MDALMPEVVSSITVHIFSEHKSVEQKIHTRFLTILFISREVWVWIAILRKLIVGIKFGKDKISSYIEEIFIKVYQIIWKKYAYFQQDGATGSVYNKRPTPMDNLKEAIAVYTPFVKQKIIKQVYWKMTDDTLNPLFTPRGPWKNEL